MTGFPQLTLRFRLYCTNMRILLVEDDHKIAAAVRQGLELESFAVDVEYDAAGKTDMTFRLQDGKLTS